VTIKEIALNSDEQKIKTYITEIFKNQDVIEYLNKILSPAIKLIKESEARPSGKEDRYINIRVDRFGFLEFFVFESEIGSKSPIEYWDWEELFSMKFKAPVGFRLKEEFYLAMFISELCFYGYPEKEMKKSLNELFFFKIESKREKLKKRYRALFFKSKSIRKKFENYPHFNRD
jgi:hypothetical protein